MAHNEEHISGNRWKDKSNMMDNPSNTNAYKAYNYFIDKGLTPEQSAGIVGNLAQESSINLKSDAENSIGAYGIAQWLGNRRKNLNKYAKEQGKNPSDFDLQLDFLWHELNTYERRAYKALLGTTTPHGAAEVFVNRFERSGEKRGDKGFDNRLKYANQFFEKFSENTDKVNNVASTGFKSEVQRPVNEVVRESTNTKQAFMEDYRKAMLDYQVDQERQQQAIEEDTVKKRIEHKMNQRKFLTELASLGDVQFIEATPPEGSESFQVGGIKDERYQARVVQDATQVRNDFRVLDLAPEPTPEDRAKEGATLQEIVTEFDEFQENPNQGTFIDGDFYSAENVLDPVVIKAKREIKLDNTSINDLEKMGANEVAKIQTELNKKGLLPDNYETRKTPKNKEETEELQQFLKSQGYNLGTYGENKDGVDGIYGRLTRQALNDYNLKASGVDGVAGKNTRNALRAYKTEKLTSSMDKKKTEERFFEFTDPSDITTYQQNLRDQGYFQGIDVNEASDKEIQKRNISSDFVVTDGDTCDDTRCTYFVGQEIEKKVKEKGRQRLDAYGDAWTITDRLIAQGAQPIYSVFNDEKPDLKKGQVTGYIKERIASTELPDIEQVKTGDVVNMFYEGSNFTYQAYKEGNKTFTTHLGIVKKDKNGNMVVEHNVGGKIYRDKLSDLAAGKGKTRAGKQLAITAITRPDYQLPESTEYYDSSIAQVDTDNVSNFSSLGSKNAALFTETIAKNKDKLLEDIPIDESEFIELTKAAKSIGWKESGFDSDVDRGLKKTLGEARELVGVRELSRGLTQMKDTENLAEPLREKYIEGKGNNLTQPTQSAIPTFYALSSRYLYLKDFIGMKDISGFTPEELVDLSTLAWNEPINKVAQTIEKYGNYDDVMEAYRGEDESHSYDLALVAKNKYLR